MKARTLARRTAATHLRMASASALAALCLLACAHAPASAQETPSGAKPTVFAKPADAYAPRDATAREPAPGPSPEKVLRGTVGELVPSVKAIDTTAEVTADASGAARLPDVSDDDDADDAKRNGRRRGFHWKPAAEQSLLFLGIQHGYALTQPKTRRDLRGPFFRDYFRSVKSLGKWEDGGRFFTNYVAHPMQGALLGHIWVQNDPRGKSARFGRSKTYWRSRLTALAWSAAWSTQFELGPVSQASIGNVGLHGKQTWIDIVITPTGGGVLLVAEDALDRLLIRPLESRTDSLLLKIAARMLLNPTRSAANLLRFKKPWHRDR